MGRDKESELGCCLASEQRDVIDREAENTIETGNKMTVGRAAFKASRHINHLFEVDKRI